MLSSMIIMFAVAGGALDTAYEHGDHWRPIDFFRVGAILVFSLILALRATTAIRFTPRNPALDDELTRANRASAAGWGFWGLMVVLFAAFAFSFYEPVSLMRIAPMLLVTGAAIAAFRFVFLERRGSRG